MAIHSKNREIIVTSISGRSAFIVASMSGRRVADMGTYSTGQMSIAERERFLADRPVYVVWSYGTPIGWVTSDNRKVVTGAKYSVTTSNHVGIVKSAFGTYEEAGA